MNRRFTNEGMKSSPFALRWSKGPISRTWAFIRSSWSKGPISHAASVISQQRVEGRYLPRVSPGPMSQVSTELRCSSGHCSTTTSA